MKTFLTVLNVIVAIVQLGVGLITLVVFAGWLALAGLAVFAEGWGAGLAVFLFGLPVIAVFGLFSALANLILDRTH